MTENHTSSNQEQQDFKRGGKIGLVLAAIIFVPLTWLFAIQPLMLKKPAEFFIAILFTQDGAIPSLHRYILSLVFIACLSPVYFKTQRFLEARFMLELPDSGLRINTGILFTLYFALVFWVLLMLANAMGLTLLITKVFNFF